MLKIPELSVDLCLHVLQTVNQFNRYQVILYTDCIFFYPKTGKKSSCKFPMGARDCHRILNGEVLCFHAGCPCVPPLFLLSVCISFFLFLCDNFCSVSWISLNFSMHRCGQNLLWDC